MALRELLDLAPCVATTKKTEATGSIVLPWFARADLRLSRKTRAFTRPRKQSGDNLRNRRGETQKSDPNAGGRRSCEQPVRGAIRLSTISLSLACSDAISGIVALSAACCKKCLPRGWAVNDTLANRSPFTREKRTRTKRGWGDAAGRRERVGIEDRLATATLILISLKSRTCPANSYTSSMYRR